MDTVRLDKFLWAMRFFKTRSLSAEACGKHRVLVNGTEAKPSRSVKAGDTLTVKKPPVAYIYNVIAITDKRQAAAPVKDYILDVTPPEERSKAAAAQTSSVQRDRGTGRPTKKERRLLDNLTPEF